MSARRAAPWTAALLTFALAWPAVADYQAGIAAYQKGDFHKAALEFAEVVKNHPDDPRYAGTFYMLGLVQSRLDQDDSAVANLTKAVQLDPQPLYILGLGQALVGARQFDRAYSELKKLDPAKLKPEQRTPCALLLARAAVKSGHGRDAVAALQARLADDPGNGDLQRALGATYQEMDMRDEAFTAFAAAFAADPDDTVSGRAAVTAGLALAGGESDSRAKTAAFARTAQVADTLADKVADYDTALLAGEAWLGAHEYDKARSWFEKASAAKPDDPLPLYYLGQTLGYLDRPDDAIGALKRAAAAHPDEAMGARIANRMGGVYASQLNFDDAIASYQEAGNTKRADEMKRLKEQYGAAAQQRRELQGQVDKLAEMASQLDALGEDEGAAKMRQRIALLKKQIDAIDRNLSSVRRVLQPQD